MSEITRVVRAAGRRLFVMEVLRALVLSVFVAVSLMVVLRIVQQVFGLAVEWRAVMILGGSIAAAGTLVWSLVARPRQMQAARVLDERANLRESLSTALSIGAPKEAWSQLVVDSARQKAATVKVSQAIPIEAPQRWHWPLAAALALGIAWTLPSWDVLGRKTKRQEEETRQKELIAVKQEIQENKKKLDELLAQVAPELKNEQGAQPRPEEVQPAALKPEQIRAAEMKRLTDLAEKLQAKANGEKGMQMEALKQLMAQLKHPGDSPMNDLYKSLAKGDFSKANEALNELKAKLAAGDMSEADKKKLAEAMQKLAEQLEKQSDVSKDLAKALEQAGADPKEASDLAKQLAANPDMIKKALEAMKNLTPEQREKLQKEMESKCKAGQKAGKMGKAAKKCAGGMQQGDMGEASEGASELSDEAKEGELSQEELEKMDQALKACEGQLASLGGQCEGGDGKTDEWQQQEGDWQEGDSNKQGQGGKGGGPGKGFGKRAGSTPTEFSTEQQKIKTKTGQGPIIGKQYVKGEQVVGESTAEFVQAVEASDKTAQEALSNGEVPPELRKTVQSYFGALKQKAKAADPTAPAAQSAEKAAEPAKK